MRDVAVFQAKLFIDGVRDFALIPISLVAGLVDLVTGEHPGHFRQVMDIGRQSERWIDLFGQHRESQGAEPKRDDRNTSGVTVPENLDAVVARLEGLVVDQYNRGGMTATTKRVIDRGLDGLTGKRSRPPEAVDPVGQGEDPSENGSDR